MVTTGLFWAIKKYDLEYNQSYIIQQWYSMLLSFWLNEIVILEEAKYYDVWNKF